MGPVDKCCSQIKPVPPSHRPFIFINHSDNGQSFWRLECSKAFKLHLLEDYVRNTQLSSKYNNHIRIMTYFRTNIKKKIFLRKCVTLNFVSIFFLHQCWLYKKPTAKMLVTFTLEKKNCKRAWKYPLETLPTTVCIDFSF